MAREATSSGKGDSSAPSGAMFTKRRYGLISVAISLLLSFCLAEGHTLKIEERSSNGGRYAYATMFYVGTPRDYEFYVATRVMIQSLKQTKTKADIIVIASRGVPTKWTKQLIEDGAVVMEKDDLPNPFLGMHQFERRFIHAVNKLHVWSLLEYDRVVMLDADNLFIRNVDELFQCGEFCAVFINPCYFHTGLFVLKPSNATFQDMLYQYPRLSNKDGADQGFLVSYYSGLLHAPFFRPPADGSRLTGGYRLPFGYQMDHSYYIIRMNWKMDGKECNPSSVITYPSAPQMKPWYWWSWPFLPLGFGWHEVRRAGIGYEAENKVVAMEAALMGLMLLMLLYWHVRHPLVWEKGTHGKCCMGRVHCSTITGICGSRCTADGGCCSSFAVFLWTGFVKALVLAAVALSFGVPFFIIPSTVHPLAGWGLLLLGSLALLLALARVRSLSLPLLPLLVPWVCLFITLVVVGYPFYSNGLQRPVFVGLWAVVGSPFLWSAVCKLFLSVDVACSSNLLAEFIVRPEDEPFIVRARLDIGDRRTACVPRSKKNTLLEEA